MEPSCPDSQAHLFPQRMPCRISRVVGTMDQYPGKLNVPCTQYPCNSNKRNVELNIVQLNNVEHHFRSNVEVFCVEINLLSPDLNASPPCSVATKPMRHRAGESKVDPAKSSHGRWALAASCISCIWFQKWKRFPLIIFMKNTNLMVGKCWKPPFVKSCLSSSHRRVAQALEDQQRFDTTRDKEELDYIDIQGCHRSPKFGNGQIQFQPRIRLPWFRSKLTLVHPLIPAPVGSLPNKLQSKPFPPAVYSAVSLSGLGKKLSEDQGRQCGAHLQRYKKNIQSLQTTPHPQKPSKAKWVWHSLTRDAPASNNKHV